MNLTGTALLSSRQRALSREQLLEQLASYQQFLQNVPYSDDVVIPTEKPEIMLDHVLSLDRVGILVEKDNKTIYEYTDNIKRILSFMPYAEYVFISALSGQRLQKLFEMIDIVRENQTLRIQTGVLNEIISEATVMQQPPSDKGKRLKIFYTTQVAVKPPTFVIFVNIRQLMHFSYQRYLENKIREAFGFKGTSIRFIIRERGEDAK